MEMQQKIRNAYENITQLSSISIQKS